METNRESRVYFVLRIIEVIAIVAGVIFAAVQIKDLRDMQSADLMLRFNESLSTEKNSSIAYSIEENRPILVANKGGFRANDIDNYLGVFELISATYRAGLITNDMLYDAFSSIITKTYDNLEIQNYLSDIRKSDSSYFVGFEAIAKALKVAEQQ